MTDPRALESAWRALAAEDRVAALAAAAGAIPLHLVGGAVRDAGLGRAVHDLDAIVADAGVEIAARLAAATGARLVALGGDRFGALRLVSGDRHIDLWDLQGGGLASDLWRRDFTVNAIALAVPGGAVTDPTGGVADLLAMRLRATRAEVFAEDPLRVLRLARLATTLAGFTVDPATIAWARSATPRLPQVAPERVRGELEALLSQIRLAPAARWFDDLGLAPLFFGKGSDEAAASAVTLHAALRLDRWRHGQIPEGLPPGQQAPAVADPPLALHWSLLTGLFATPGSTPASRLRDLRRRGLMTRSCCDSALRLLEPGWEVPASDSARRHWLHTAGRPWRDALALRAVLGRAESAVEEWKALEAAILGWPESERRSILSPPTLLSGVEIQELLAIAPGPAVGAALSRVRRAQVEGVVRTREAAERLLLAESAAD